MLTQRRIPLRRDYLDSLKKDRSEVPVNERGELNPSPVDRPAGQVGQDELMLLMGGFVNEEDINTVDPDKVAMHKADMDADEENLITDVDHDWQVDRRTLGMDNASIQASAGWLNQQKNTVEIRQDSVYPSRPSIDRACPSRRAFVENRPSNAHSFAILPVYLGTFTSVIELYGKQVNNAFSVH